MFLSIVIPVYNAERYLAPCLEACLAQDLPAGDYEILCVDDGSTDGSPAILAQYAAAHSCIRVLTQPNGGVSAARNTGICAARGEYLWFVDADDIIQTDVLGMLRQHLEQTPVDQLRFGHYEFPDPMSAEELAKKEARQLPRNGAPPGYLIVTSLFRRELIRTHSLQFRVGISYAEDGLFLYEWSQLQPTAATLDEVLYFYRRNPTSATRQKSEAALRKQHDSALQVARVMTGYARKHRDELAGGDPDRLAAVLMPEVRTILISAARLPRSHRRELLAELSGCGLFPLFLYRKPRDWFPRKIHMSHAYMGLKGKLLDVMQFYSVTRPGFAALVLYYKLRRKG